LHRGPFDSDAAERQEVIDYIKEKGPATPGAMRTGLGLPRRTLSRILAELVDAGTLHRMGNSPNDPSATYRLSVKER
jgi:predicted HTH transcriptional regulator